MISCTDQGSWDFDVEDCQAEQTKVSEKLETVPKEFLKEFKAFLFYSCETENSDKSKLCNFYKTGFDSDLSSFELPETPEFEGMDAKLLHLLMQLSDSSRLNLTNAENFLENLLDTTQDKTLTRDVYRFVSCLYLDLILIEDTYDKVNTDNINDNIKSILKKITMPIYKHYLHELHMIK